MKSQLATIELERDEMKFSSGHFTIFSPTKRENIHGHNFTVAARITAEYTENGMAFDYAVFKKKLVTLCDELDGNFLLPEKSTYLKIQLTEHTVRFEFNDDHFVIPRRDVVLLPMTNITLEELSQWFIQRLIADQKNIKDCHITEITIKVYTMPGQAGETTWRLNDV